MLLLWFLDVAVHKGLVVVDKIYLILIKAITVVELALTLS